MLKSLKIHNIALITDSEINFSEGLNVLSGETGSGKSVILDSINFVLGQKADKSMIRHGQSECWASCVFDISNLPQVKLALSEIGVEEDDEIIIKRTFNENGKGTIKLNGETVTASMVKKITGLLVDVHGQSDHFILLKESAQLDMLDQLGGEKISLIKGKISEIINEIKAVNSKLSLFGGSDQERLNRIDYLTYSINEIVNANLYVGEDEELNEKRKKLQNIEKIFSSLGATYDILNGENGVADMLSASYRQLDSISGLGDDYSRLCENIENILSQLQEINSEISNNLEEEFDEAEADRIESRIEEISRLKLKYNGNVEHVLSQLKEMEAELELISSSAKQIEILQADKNKFLTLLNKEYNHLSNERKVIGDKLSKNLEERLRLLAMKNAKFSVEFEKIDESELISTNGFDKITFMFSANAGEPLKPLSKVISGGELSRLMLAIKCVSENVKGAQTFVFDEIDSGISGVTAMVVGENFAKIAVKNQIIAISHLPQIVAMSDSSLLIKKSENDSSTQTEVFPMSEREKLLEVVRLIGGDDSSLSAQNHAKELIEKCNKYKNSL